MGVPSDTHAPHAFHRRLPGYDVTPVHALPVVAAELGWRQVWVKDESSRLGLPSFKILGVTWAVIRCLEQRRGALGEWRTWADLAAWAAGSEVLTLVAATDGNHGRALARTACLLGLSADVFVPRDLSAARVKPLHDEGARVRVVDGDYDAAVQAAAEHATSDGRLLVADTSFEGYHEVPRWIVEGYSTLFWEIDEQLTSAGGGPPALVVVPVGVGSLAQATVRHYARSIMDGRTRVVTVEPLDADCLRRSLAAGRRVPAPGPHRSVMAGLNCGTLSLDAWPDLREGVFAALALADEPVLSAMAELGRCQIPAGECGAASLAALRALADDQLGRELTPHREGDVVLLSTEEAAASDRGI
jgi:diaminopropionate ammonia-lyase